MAPAKPRLYTVGPIPEDHKKLSSSEPEDSSSDRTGSSFPQSSLSSNTTNSDISTSYNDMRAVGMVSRSKVSKDFKPPRAFNPARHSTYTPIPSPPLPPPPPHPGLSPQHGRPFSLPPVPPPISSPLLPRPDSSTLNSQHMGQVHAPQALTISSPILPRSDSLTSVGTTGTSPRTGSDFLRSSSSSNTKVAPTFTIPSVDESLDIPPILSSRKKTLRRMINFLGLSHKSESNLPSVHTGLIPLPPSLRSTSGSGSGSGSPALTPAPNLHWQLHSYHPARPNLSLHFDVAFPIHDIEYVQYLSYGIQRTPQPDADLDKPAADKKLTKMTINFQCDPFTWDIDVEREEGIRVRDVLEAIYSAFDLPLTFQERSLIPHCLRAECEEAFKLRCNLAPVLPIVQQRQGWKRVDALLHETIFRGLAQSKRGDWTLHLSGTTSKVIDKRHLIADHIAADPAVRYQARGLLWDPILELDTTTSHSLPTPPALEDLEYLPPCRNQNLNALPNYSNNDIFNLPLSAAFVPRTVMGSDMMLPSRGACRICNFARLSAILQHGTLCTLLNNIPPLISDPLSQDYTWAFFCRFVPLGALFDSPGRGPLPMIQLGSDRARFVDRLEATFKNPSNAMLWLHGPSGTGKSVIAYTLASRCRQKNILAGSFFFSPSHANCRSACSLVIALAYQLGLSQPQAKEKIIEVLDSDPGIIFPSRGLREQFARLLIEPLEAVDWRSPSRVFIIDAIDQCQDQMPELISLLTRLLSHLNDVGLHIFFTSRDYIKGVLIKRQLFPMISDIALDHSGITRDVRLFLRQSFDKIHKRHQLQCPRPWPPEEMLGRLVDRVGSHFITGSIIVKFIGSLDHDPTDRMDIMDHVSLNPSSPSESSMDDFYKSIISTADDPEQAYLHLTIVVNLAGMLSYLQLDNLLNRGSNQKFDMRSALSQLSPLVHTPDGHDNAVQVCHESLCDFLSDPIRCGEQFISQVVVHRLLAYSSLSIMMKELPDDNPLCSRLSQLATESGFMSFRALDNAVFLSLAMCSPPEPLLFLSMLWHIAQGQYTGLQDDSRTKLALQYFCRTWQVLQHLDLSAVDALPAFRVLANIRSLPVLLAFPIFLAFESPRSGQTRSPSTSEYDHRIETLDIVAKIVADVHALKDQHKTDSGALDYACTHWAYHLSLAEWDDDLRSIVTAFMRQKLQQWLLKAWCFQDLETCLRTLCEVLKLCLAANLPIHFDPDAQCTDAKTKAEEGVEGTLSDEAKLRLLREIADANNRETMERAMIEVGVGPSSSKQKHVAFSEGTEQVFQADEWDRSPSEIARRLSYEWQLNSCLTAHQKRCQAFLSAGKLDKALEAHKYMMDTIDETAKASCLVWSNAFKQECSALFAANGDAALAASDYDRAIELYSAAITLLSASSTVFANRSKAKLGKMLWMEALLDAEKVIKLDSLSYLGYNLKHAALHGAQLYDEAIQTFQTMLTKLDDAPDIQTRNLRQRYIRPSEAEHAIRQVIDTQLENAPLRILDTTTGLLCDWQAQISAFKISTEYKELLSSTITCPDFHMKRIEEVVRRNFQYAMLSHRWEGREPLLQDIQGKSVYDSELDSVGGMMKLRSFCKTAHNAGYSWAWSDTCCIDKNNNVEVQESVNSMFVWYRHSALTIVYLSDVPPSSKSGALAKSIWNTRGWTVQEFIAPKVILFYQSKWTLYLDDRTPNHKDSVAIMQELEDATGIDRSAVVAYRPSMHGAREKLHWASTRVTTRQEDIAYSLFGIFGVRLPVDYGERQEKALGRLLQEIVARSGDITSLDWVGKSSEFNSCLPASITSYQVPPCKLPVLPEDEIQSSVSSLRQTVAVDFALNLYTQLRDMRVPRFAAQRLLLPCIAFNVREVRRVRGPATETQFTYRVKADGLRSLEITTEEALVQFWPARPILQKFILVRPWDWSLLELPEFVEPTEFVEPSDFGDDTESEEDYGMSPSSRSHDLSGDYPGEQKVVDKESRAFRLLVRLRQPFSAFLLAQQRGGEYKRIASDHDIIGQVNDVRDLMNFRTIEIL